MVKKSRRIIKENAETLISEYFTNNSFKCNRKIKINNPII